MLTQDEIRLLRQHSPLNAAAFALLRQSIYVIFAKYPPRCSLLSSGDRRGRIHVLQDSIVQPRARLTASLAQSGWMSRWLVADRILLHGMRDTNSAGRDGAVVPNWRVF